MARLGVIAGSAPFAMGNPVPVAVDLQTPWGEASAAPRRVLHGDNELLVLARHGDDHSLNPHSVNYRANIWMLAQLEVDGIVATHTVGSIDPALPVGGLVLPEQLIDYTWGRAQTYDDQRRHIEFSAPYDARLRNAVIAVDHGLTATGVYGCTQGPRLETAAEIRRMANDGCTLVGMTGMPEAALARELQVPYVSLCVVVNPAAGVVDGPVDLEALRAASEQGAGRIWQLLERLQIG